MQNLRGTAAVSALTQLVDESQSLGKTGKAEHVAKKEREPEYLHEQGSFGIDSGVLFYPQAGAVCVPAGSGIPVTRKYGRGGSFSAAFFAAFAL